MIELVQTSSACPEQYDVMIGSERIGFLHLRHGRFSASTEGPSGPEVYVSHPRGDGIFERDERDEHISAGIAAIAKASIRYVIR